MQLSPTEWDLHPPEDAPEQWMQGWAERNNCMFIAEPVEPVGSATGIHYTGCRDNAEVVLYRVNGMGHNWPGGSELPFMGAAAPDVHASEIMWAFFQQHPMP